MFTTNYKLLLKVMMLIAFVFSICGTTHADDKIKLRLHQPPPNQLGVKDLWKLDITNTTRENINIYLTGTATESKKGLIVSGKSKVISVSPGKKTYDYNDFKNGGDVNWKDKSIQEVLLRTGNVPEGEYTICVTAFYENNEVADQESCIEQSIKQSGSITLISPEDGAEIDVGGIDVIVVWPVFTWTPLPGAKDYTLRIVEIKGEQSPESAIKENKAFFEKEGIRTTNYQYGVADPKFEEGKKYAWGIGSNGVWSQIWWWSWSWKKPTCKNFKVSLVKNVTGIGGKDSACCYDISITNSYNGLSVYKPKSFLITTNNANIISAAGTPAGWSRTPTTVSPNTNSIVWKKSGYIPTGTTNLGTVCFGNNTTDPFYVHYKWLDKKRKVLCKDSVKVGCKKDSIPPTCCVYRIQIYNFLSPAIWSKIRVVGENNSKIIAASGDEWTQYFNKSTPGTVTWFPEDMPDDADELESDIGAGGETDPIDNEFYIKLDPNISGSNQDFRIEFLDENGNVICTQKISIPCMKIDFDDEKMELIDWTQYTTSSGNDCRSQMLAVAVPWDCIEFEEMAHFKIASTCNPIVNIWCYNNNQYNITLDAVYTGSQYTYLWTYTDYTGYSQTNTNQSFYFIQNYGWAGSVGLTVTEQIITEISTPDPQNPNGPPIITHETTYVAVCTSSTDINLNFGSIDFTYKMKDCNPLELTFTATGMNEEDIINYEWTQTTTNASFPGSFREPVYTLPAYSTLYNIKLRVTDKYGCKHEISKDIKVEPSCNPSFSYVYDYCAPSTDGGITFYNMPTTATITFENTSTGGDCNAIYKWEVGASLTTLVTVHTGTRNNPPPPLPFNVTPNSPWTSKIVKLTMTSAQCPGGQSTTPLTITFKPCSYNFTVEVCGDETVVFKTDPNNPTPVWDFPGHRLIHDYLLYNYDHTHTKKHQYDDGSYSATMTIINPVTRCRCIVTKNFTVYQQFCCEKKDKEKRFEIITINGKHYRWKVKLKVKGAGLFSWTGNKIKARSNFTRVLSNYSTFAINIYWFGASKRIVNNTINISGILRTELPDECPCREPHSYSSSKTNDPWKVRTKIRDKPALVVNGVEKHWKVKSNEVTATYTLDLIDKNNNAVITAPKYIILVNHCK